MMASMDAEAEMENLFAEDEAEEEQPGTQSLTQEEGMIYIMFVATFLNWFLIMRPTYQL